MLKSFIKKLKVLNIKIYGKKIKKKAVADRFALHFLPQFLIQKVYTGEGSPPLKMSFKISPKFENAVQIFAKKYSDGERRYEFSFPI